MPDPADMIEALFFAYRDFVGDADAILETYGFGRAHHRVLHFVGTRPGLTIAELLSILTITKQSLNRVLKELVREGYIDVQEGPRDKRQRLLFLTEKGSALTSRLTQVQVTRITHALQKTGSSRMEAAHDFLKAMTEPCA